MLVGDDVASFVVDVACDDSSLGPARLLLFRSHVIANQCGLLVLVGGVAACDGSSLVPWLPSCCRRKRGGVRIN